MILEESGWKIAYGKRFIKWKARCDCGKEVIISSTSLSAKTKSCGCLQKDAARKTGYENTLGPGGAASNNLLTRYKRDARQSGVPFNLDKQQFIKLILSDCFYCGNPPVSHWRKKESPYPLKYNGLDKIEPKKGYTKENVVTCCIKCNRSKSDSTQASFFEMVSKIYKRHLGNRSIPTTV